MDRLKDNTGLIVLGAAAIATAGFLLFKGGNKGRQDTDVSMREETEEILENCFFLDATKTYAENKAVIAKWTKEQCLAI